MRITKKELNETVKLIVKRKLLEMDMMDMSDMGMVTSDDDKDVMGDKQMAPEDAYSPTGSNSSEPAMHGAMTDDGMTEMGASMAAPPSSPMPLPKQEELDQAMTNEWDMEMTDEEQLAYEYAAAMAGKEQMDVSSGKELYEVLKMLSRTPSPESTMDEQVLNKIDPILTEWGSKFDKPIQVSAKKLAETILTKLGFVKS